MRLITAVALVFLFTISVANESDPMEKSERMGARFYTFLEDTDISWCGSKAAHRNIELYYEVSDIPRDTVMLRSGSVGVNKWIGKGLPKEAVTFYQISGQKTVRHAGKCIWLDYSHENRAPDNCHFKLIQHDGKNHTSVLACVSSSYGVQNVPQYQSDIPN